MTISSPNGHKFSRLQCCGTVAYPAKTQGFKEAMISFQLFYTRILCTLGNRCVLSTSTLPSKHPFAHLLSTAARMEGEETSAAAGAGITMSSKRKVTRKTKIEEGVRRANDGDLIPQKRFFRERAHINPLNQALAFQ